MNDHKHIELLTLQAAELTERTPFCPKDQQIAEYFEEQLPEAERDRLERHLADCRFCLACLGMLQRLAQDPVAPRLRKTCWRPQSQCVTRWLPARNESQPGPLRRCWSPRSWYGNHQGCDFTAETCDVFASMWVYRGPDTPSVHAYHGLNGLEDTGLIRIGGTGTVPAVIREGDVPEANPFSGDRVMDIEALTIKFQLAGRNSFAAECAYAATEPGEITFRTAKVQVTP